MTTSQKSGRTFMKIEGEGTVRNIKVSNSRLSGFDTIFESSNPNTSDVGFRNIVADADNPFMLRAGIDGLTIENFTGPEEVKAAVEASLEEVRQTKNPRVLARLKDYLMGKMSAGEVNAIIQLGERLL